jgi:hypothetical protein
MLTIKLLQRADQSVQTCRKRKARSSWDEHKDVIIREYKQGGMCHVQQYIKEHYGFEAKYV